jgi:pre-rRNA-processing protein TSR3
MDMPELDILILRDPKESKKKCSLTPLAGREGVTFRTYHPDRRIDAGGRILLDPNGEPFTEADRGIPIFLIDCAWRRVPTLSRTVDGEMLRRRLPNLVTAYPRKSNFFEDPVRGLASIEALYAASFLVGAARPDLLDAYYWREEFLQLNRELLASLLPK